jgi:lipopolysaccharide transport system ATP-binding protein
VDAVDVRRPVGVEITFDVLQPGTALFPKIKLTTAQSEIAFNALDTDARWREPVEPGGYVSTAWIPGNLLNEGMVSVDVGLASLEAPKLAHHVNLPGVLTFHVQDLGSGESAKGLFTGQLRGVVRPLLEWSSVRR